MRVRRRRTHLKDRFGREYQRTVEMDGTGAGERRLAELENQRDDLDLRTLIRTRGAARATTYFSDE